ncbi:hypothetical protein [Amycolatopsis sp. lyj-109]|uniref:hypothetical protein n=1 Tax=Amycolatopsis sp. lyj-109 TaxID=2789287 RepID=UPI00397B328F
MRLVRLERQQSRVADDIRAALASLGRGSTVIGGIALVGVAGVTDRPIEAVVLLPHGVIIVIGVDLPDPALRLEAPLGGPWKADGWPLVADDDSVNPATEALDVSQACERQIAELVPGTAPVGTIIAVGPYVETVDQPATDLAGPVRVLHPTPTTMLAATVSLATAHRPRSVDQVRALIRGLAPSAPEFSDEVLLGEGFSRLTDDSPPESLWDDGPGVGGAAPVAGTGGPAVSAVSAGLASAGTTDWRTATPVKAPAAVPDTEPDVPSVAETAAPRAGVPASTARVESDRPAVSSARPVFPGTEAAEVLPSPAQAEAESADPAARPASPDAAEADAEPTEVLPAPAQPEPDHPADPTARPVFPGTEAPEAPSWPGAIPSGEPEPAESPAAGAERTENLRVPSSSSEQIAALALSAEAGQPPETPAPQPAEPGATNAEPAQAGSTTPRPVEAEAVNSRPAAPERLIPRPTQAGPGTSQHPAEAEPATAHPIPEPRQTRKPPLPSPQSFPRPRPTPAPAAAPRTVRWLPLGAIGALVLLAGAAIAVAATGDGTAAAPAPPPVTSRAAPVTTPVRSLQFALRAAGGDQRCASHAFGDAQASLQQTSCSGVKRASYAATVDGRPGAVTVGIIDFPDAAQAAAFKAVADTPGGGGVLDLATETGQWGATPTPRFENAAYASKLDGSSVRLVQAVWAPGPSTPDDPGLVRAAKGALDLPDR